MLQYVCVTKISKKLNFLVNTWVFKGRNAPKPIFGRGSARTPLGELTILPRSSSHLHGEGTPPPHSPPPSTSSSSRSRRLRRLASDPCSSANSHTAANNNFSTPFFSRFASGFQRMSQITALVAAITLRTL